MKHWLLLCYFLSGICGLCEASCPQGVSVKEDAEALTIFITGEEFGMLKPCGCFGGQLGGLSKRAAILGEVERSSSFIIDTGTLVGGEGEQELLKFTTFIQAFGLLDYDLLHLNEQDAEIARNLGILENVSEGLSIITSFGLEDANLPGCYRKVFYINGKELIVNVCGAKGVGDSLFRALSFFPAGANSVDILIVEERSPETLKRIDEAGVVECVICPSESDEPEVIRGPNTVSSGALVFSVGRYGKYVCKLKVRNTSNQLKDKIRFSYVPVSEDLPEDESLVELYDIYQQLVKEAGLLKNYPRLPVGNGLEYVGSESCQACHSYEYRQWSKKAHADAYATLVEDGTHYDPECVICHVVGMEYESGFITEEQTPHLINVGCENCHGPGSRHIAQMGQVPASDPKMDCTDCHTPEHSGDYASNELEYFEKIVHWREPNAPNSVK